MERVIKFRAWHKETGAFLKIWPYNWQDGIYTNGKPNKYFDNKFQFSEDNNECNRIEGKSCFLTIDGLLVGILPIDNLTHKTLDYTGEYILSQFTGLHDKNGKEIYEGDLLIQMSKDLGTMEVYYEDGSYCLKNKFNRWGLLSRAFDPDIQKFYSPFVIGNRYENPELLNS